MTPPRKRRLDEERSFGFPLLPEIFSKGVTEARRKGYLEATIVDLLDNLDVGEPWEVVASVFALSDRFKKNNVEKIIAWIEKNLSNKDEVRRWSCYRLISNLTVAERLTQGELKDFATKLIIRCERKNQATEDEALCTMCLIGAELRFNYHQELPVEFWFWIDDWIGRLPIDHALGVHRLIMVQSGFTDLIVTSTHIPTVVLTVKKYAAHAGPYCVIPDIVNSLPVQERKSAVRLFQELIPYLKERSIPLTHLQSSLKDIRLV